MRDDFAEALSPGAVVGSSATGGGVRLGRDVEGLLSADNHALRIAPHARPGWGRAGVSYGPFPRENGLGLAVLILNGHNNSQSEYDIRPKYRRLGRSLKRLVLRLLGSYKAPPVPAHHPGPLIRDNLAIGWFDSDSPPDPTVEGISFVVAAADAENAVLETRVGGRRVPVVTGMQNVQIAYIAILRDRGAAYYVASVNGAREMAAYPTMRPVAIDSGDASDPESVYAGVWQSVLGQGGFRTHSRVYGVRAGIARDLTAWYGTAHAADRFGGAATGDTTAADRATAGAVDRRHAEIGGTWTVATGSWMSTPEGAIATGDAVAYLDPGQSTGLLHGVIERAPSGAAGLVWRLRDPNHFWCVIASADSTTVFVVEGGQWSKAATAPPTSGEGSIGVQILDDGDSMRITVDGRPLLPDPVRDDRIRDGTGVGLVTRGAMPGTRFASIEAHPRSLPIPSELDPGRPWEPTPGALLVSDDFAGAAGDLEGRRVSNDAGSWRRIIGKGRLDMTGSNEVVVRATPHRPNPGRTAYAVDWAESAYADLSAEFVLPGESRGQGITGRPGFIFYQDADNFLIVNAWNADYYAGGAISAFFRLGGREELDRSVWTNVGSRFTRGKAFDFRVAFDGMRFLAYLGDEPVLYRALTDAYPRAQPIQIRMVGLVANWEYGDDMGSRFRRFEARGPRGGSAR